MPYPVTFEADYAERRNRLTTLVRLILAIPLAIVLYIYGLLATVAIVIAWFAIVITARYPDALYSFVAGFTRFVTRFTAYVSLLTDPYPAFWGEEDDDYPVRMHFAGPLERYSRWRTLLRVFLAIPIVILRWAIGALLEIGAVGAWVVILVTGRMPRGLFDLMVLANSYTARSDAYIYLLTETYPPFQDEQTRAAGLETTTPGQLEPPLAPGGAASDAPRQLQTPPEPPAGAA
jgi:hypothetical protein